MKSVRPLTAIPDDELLRRLAALLEGSRHAEADLVAHIGEVDARRLYAREASPSMFVYCTGRLHLSEAEAYLRIAAARVSREHPTVLEMLADGRLHLTGIALLAPHLTRENRDVLLQRATHKTKREIEELVAELAPLSDVAPSMRRLPRRRLLTSPASTGRVPPGGVTLPAPLVGVGPNRLAVTLELRPEQVDSDRLNEPVPPHLDPRPDAGRSAECEPPSEGAAKAELALRWVAARKPGPALIEPLSPARYKVQFTASAMLRDKLERLQALMRSSVPDGDLGAIIDAAVTEKLERLEARRYARTRSPRTTLAGVDTSRRKREVPAAVKRAEHERDGGRCRYVDEQGRRCTAHAGLEFHHRLPFALGGDHSPSNVSLPCKAHNQHLAQVDFGGEVVGRGRRLTAGPPPASLET